MSPAGPAGTLRGDPPSAGWPGTSEAGGRGSAGPSSRPLWGYWVELVGQGDLGDGLDLPLFAPRGQRHASCSRARGLSPSKPRGTPCPLGGRSPVSTSGPSETVSSDPERCVQGDALLWDSDLGPGLWVRPHLCNGRAQAHPLREAGTPGVAAGTPGAGAAFSCSPLSKSPRPTPRPPVALVKSVSEDARGLLLCRCPSAAQPCPCSGVRAWGGNPVSSSPACSPLEAPAPAALEREATDADRSR